MKKVFNFAIVFFTVIIFYSCAPCVPCGTPTVQSDCPNTPGLPANTVQPSRHVQFINTSSTAQRILVFNQHDDDRTVALGALFDPSLGDFVLQPCSFVVKDYTNIPDYDMPQSDVRVYVIFGVLPLTGGPDNREDKIVDGIPLGSSIRITNTGPDRSQ